MPVTDTWVIFTYKCARGLIGFVNLSNGDVIWHAGKKPKNLENKFYHDFHILCLNICKQIALIFSNIYTTNCSRKMFLLWVFSTRVTDLYIQGSFRLFSKINPKKWVNVIYRLTDGNTYMYMFLYIDVLWIASNRGVQPKCRSVLSVTCNALPLLLLGHFSFFGYSEHLSGMVHL